jgi:hypothetical protein
MAFDQLIKSQVTSESFNDEAYHTSFNMKKRWLSRAEANWPTIEEGAALTKYVSASSPDVRSQFLPPDAPYWRGLGGLVTVQVGESVPINITEQNEGMLKKVDRIPVVYQDSSQLEFYYYRRPVVSKIEPTSGLLQGGTPIDVTGYWFDEKPEYGLFPFCRIGSNAVRAKFI